MNFLRVRLKPSPESEQGEPYPGGEGKEDAGVEEKGKLGALRGTLCSARRLNRE